MAKSKKEYGLSISVTKQSPLRDQFSLELELTRIFGLERTQSYNCARMILRHEAYVVHHTDTYDKAREFREECVDSGIICIILER